MCVIVRKPKNIVFTEEKFRECWKRNSHGVGFVAINGSLISEKGLMNLEDALSKTKPYFGEQYDLVLHFRIKSRGDVSASLTHPFNYDNFNLQRFLFHNGTVRILNSGVTTSDTEILGNWLKHLNDDDVDRVIGVLLKRKYGRFVTVVCNPHEVENYTIKVYEDDLSKVVDGVWYSNTIHEGFSGPPPLVGDGADDDVLYPLSSQYRKCPPTPPSSIASKKLTDIRMAKTFEYIKNFVTPAYLDRNSDNEETIKQIIMDGSFHEVHFGALTGMKNEEDLLKYYLLGKH